MANQPIGATVTIIGIESPAHGASCAHHDVCGNMVQVDSILRLRKTTIKLGKWIVVFLLFSNVASQFSVSYRPSQFQDRPGGHLGKPRH